MTDESKVEVLGHGKKFRPGKLLKLLREQGYSYRSFGQEAGWARGKVYHLVSGNVPDPKVGDVWTMATVLGADPGYFMRTDEEMENERE